MTAGVHRLPFKWLRVAVLEHLNSLISRNILIAFKFGGEEKHNQKKKIWREKLLLNILICFCSCDQLTFLACISRSRIVDLGAYVQRACVECTPAGSESPLRSLIS